jgi:hypothetical protein
MAHRLIVEEVPPESVRVLLRRDGQSDEETFGEAIPFASPLDAKAREDLRWYLEDYLAAPFAVYEERGRAVQVKLGEWGRALFDAVFGTGKRGRDAYLQVRGAPCELVLRLRSPGFSSLPWELLQDPEQATPLALALHAIDRTLVATGGAAPIPPGEGLRVLTVIARPAGLQDVGYQMIARPLLRRLEAVRGEVQLEVLRPPTLEELNRRLTASVSEEQPYHVIHFDGHGTFGTGLAAGTGSPY